MTRSLGSTSLVAVIAAMVAAFEADAASAQATIARPDGETAVVEVLGGTATFEAGTSIPAINVHGKSINLQGRAQIRQTGNAITIVRMEASLPVKTISTGVALRDEHMRKYVFATEDGQLPDVTFVAENVDCAPPAGAGRESTCNLAGQLAIRGTSRAFAIALKVNKAGDGYRAAGDGMLKLSAYGISPPSQFGVTTTDEVKLHLQFTATAATGQLALRAGGPR